MADLEVYIDEGEVTHGSTTVFAVAGSAATVEGWRAFEGEWGPLVSPLPKPYHSCDNSCAFLADRLADLMIKYTLQSFAAIINVGSFEALVPAEVRSRFGSTYRLGVFAVTGQVANWAREHRPTSSIFYNIEPGHRGFEGIGRFMSKMHQDESYRAMMRMSGWAAATKEALPLHCADTLANHSARWAREQITPFMAKLHESGRLRTIPLDQSFLREKYLPEMEGLLRDSKSLRRAAKYQKWLGARSGGGK